jgi:hypothetical protein
MSRFAVVPLDVPFSVADRATWPEVLTLSHIAAIYQRGIGGVRRDLERRTFVPAPFRKYPYSWRKTDVERHLLRKAS